MGYIEEWQKFKGHSVEFVFLWMMESQKFGGWNLWFGVYLLDDGVVWNFHVGSVETLNLDYVLGVTMSISIHILLYYMEIIFSNYWLRLLVEVEATSHSTPQVVCVFCIWNVNWHLSTNLRQSFKWKQAITWKQYLSFLRVAQEIVMFLANSKFLFLNFMLVLWEIIGRCLNHIQPSSNSFQSHFPFSTHLIFWS